MKRLAVAVLLTACPMRPLWQGPPAPLRTRSRAFKSRRKPSTKKKGRSSAPAFGVLRSVWLCFAAGLGETTRESAYQAATRRPPFLLSRLFAITMLTSANPAAEASAVT